MVGKKRTGGRKTTGHFSFTTGQIATMLDLAPRTVSRFIDRGTLPGYRIPLSQDRRVLRTELIRFIKANNMLMPDCLKHSGTFLVLTVGMDKHSIESLTSQLPETEDYSIVSVDNAFQAGMKISKYTFNAMVIDFSGMGPTAAFSIAVGTRFMPEHEEVDITALVSEDGLADWKVNGAIDTVLQKPVPMYELAKVIRSKKK